MTGTGGTGTDRGADTGKNRGTTSPRRVVVDCDPGHDDALALLMAAGHPDVEIAAITTVGGNQTLEKVTRNALAVATVAGLEHAVVAAGCDRPLVADAVITAPRTHGASGLDGPVLPAPTVALDPRHGVDVIIETVMAAEPGTITLVPMGPLTNIATAVRREPAVVGRVAEVVLMGGGYTKGNITPAAEFNIYTDPEAAHVVFAAPWRVTMVGLDLTHQARATEDVVERFRALGTRAGDFVVDMLDFFGPAYRAEQGFPAPPVHDVCALVRAVEPDVVTVRPGHVDVELRGEHTRGMTVTDLLGREGRDLDHLVATELDVDRFWDLVIGAVSRLD
ncbi:nucleoside hydrolase [Georgenia subflava]|uniref:Ribonucleoside hydrolase n=1 Tax=Georgenia subflava TaxID=1622177 RepID=A0A6N7EFB1_9MICO|nr:nucleoside hydrolase [Georgenia subflava]MPV36799.1 ribonucleoside hydrolase [Georgenia subflava]